MAKGKPNNKRYKYPLPIHPIDSLPQLFPHNPISWAYWVYCYYKSVNYLEFRIPIEIVGSRYPHILVKDVRGMEYLWRNGFFGTGQLSRSEPTWLERTSKRINNVINKGDPNLSLEKITQIRRAQRAHFKKQRKAMDDNLLEMRKNGCTKEEENRYITEQREHLRELRDVQLSDSLGPSDQNTDLIVKFEDDEIINDQNEIINLESLELLPVEAIFLTYALPVLDTKLEDLFNILLRKSQDNEAYSYNNIENIVKQYLIYHHYRSRGWSVRSGIKFGCEYLLYKRGPPFQHAQFCVMSLGYEESKPYEWYSSLSRVTSNAKKSLILCYIETLKNEDEIIKLWNKQDYTSVFSSYRISEVVYNRWMPGKNRD
ncbi:hypothetical protein TPHA_0A01660 [Tetrapisispora phaffii CBS 4417]|uniref:tRNA-splicing endonuclease subunit Sen2 n=1 Tax=Tetrapisispora phaffii (strain ATCC 24235 / CBS 4417 / NBRC 1672 / NRRL Y-8282 / UCD 70-5) TaxID=1071381 RepID=G8BMX1_TETPH|nr:hypothetical protein TPHA_0A01660 [Tetrapisispora phaffii CBS 4417]CCE61249.1 hypothetical protein TPHA_0A01660 [Tetrapisispora phaffii CBS 4417]